MGSPGCIPPTGRTDFLYGKFTNRLPALIYDNMRWSIEDGVGINLVGKKIGNGFSKSMNAVFLFFPSEMLTGFAQSVIHDVYPIYW